jgi:hypothetical protein
VCCALLDGWERVIVRSGRRSASSAAAVTAAVRKYFPDSRAPLDSYAGLVAGMPGKDRTTGSAVLVTCRGNPLTMIMIRGGENSSHGVREGLGQVPT